jgi:hypothetical protein
MKIQKNLILLCGLALTTSLFSGCASVSIPPSKHYEVKIGDTTVRAKTVQIRGKWVTLEGVDWTKGAGPRQTPSRMLVPLHALSHIDYD